MRPIAVASLVISLSLAASVALGADEKPSASGTFQQAGSLAEGRNTHTATLLPDGRVLVIGGGGKEARFSAEVWDPASSSFEPAGQLAKGRKTHTATLLLDGSVLVVGGGRAIVNAEVWDPATAGFGPAGRLIEGRNAHAATLLPDGRVLIVGGWKAPDWLATAEVWDPETASFESTGSLAEARVGHTATLLDDGRVLIVGGHGANVSAPIGGVGGYPDEPRASAEVWDATNEAFSPAGTLAEMRTGHTATLLADGRVLIIGGSGLDGEATLAEVWDPATAAFEPAGSLIEPRLQHTATLVPDGRVLIVGGMGTASAEVWDPAIASFIPAGSPATRRRLHTATVLPDGRVLVVGGLPRDVSSSAEVWEPLTLTDEQLGNLAEDALLCGELRASFRGDGISEEPQLDPEYLARCLTCEELSTRLTYRRLADLDLGLAVFNDLCRRESELSPSGQRVEVADFGIVAWVPDGWTATTIADEPELGFIQVGLDRYGADAEMRPVFIAEQPKQPDQARPQGCSLAWYGPLALTPDEALAALYGDEPYVTLESLDGQMSRASFEDPLSRDTHHEQYALDAGDAIAFLWCFSSEPRRDDWYSIARSIRFTPAAD